MPFDVIRGAGVPVSHLPFSPATGAGGFVFVSGQASVDDAGAIVVDTFEGEFRRSVENVKRILAAANLTLADVVQVPADDIEGLATLMAQHSDTIAAVLTEPVQGAAGIYPPSDGYLASLRKLCDQHGAHLIFDEVITGFGRLGSWFGAHHFDVRPDMVTFAKAVSSGYQPLGGVFVGPAPRAGLEADPDFFMRHGFTYSGHPTACAAGLTNLAILRREGLLERAKHVGARLSDGLRSLASDGVIDHTRGEGAMWAAGLHESQNAMAMRDEMLRRGVITRAINTDTLTFCPPLVITDEQIDRIIDTLAAVAAV